MSDRIKTQCERCDKISYAKLETQLAEATERADKAARDGWLKTAETQLARAKKAEAQLTVAIKWIQHDCPFDEETIRSMLEKTP